MRCNIQQKFDSDRSIIKLSKTWQIRISVYRCVSFKGLSGNTSFPYYFSSYLLKLNPFSNEKLGRT
jgi:hypothetical protein